MRKVLLVTGSSRGIGAAVARLAAQQGYAVGINYRQNHEAAQTLMNEITAAGGQAILIQGDVGIEADVVRMFEAVDRELGKLTAFVNNAGILEQQQRLDEMDVGRLQRVFNTNIIGAFVCAREAVKRMSTRYGGSGGAIVNLSSAASRLGSPGEFIDYAASKGAIDTMTIGLAKEVAAEGIRVNAVRPGLIATDIHISSGEPDRAERLKTAVPMQRVGAAAEVAQTILWLLSDESSYCTGALLDVSGGR